MKRITNKSEFDELISGISECLKWHDRENFAERSYNLRLDNGEDLRIVFNYNNLAHLLGIDTEYLKTTGLFKGSSYEILKMICNDSYRLYNMIRQGHLTFENFISDFAFDKVRGFKNICGIDLYNIEFICKYSKECSYVTGYEQQDGDYYIAYKAGNENGLFIIGLKKDGNYYYPMTNRFVDFNNEESKRFLEVLLTNQTITMPTYSHLYFFNTKSISDTMYIDYRKKPSLIRQSIMYAQEYGAISDVAVGYKYIIEKLLQRMDSNSNLTKILNEIICKYINSGRKINKVTLKKQFGNLPDDIVSWVDGYNDLLDGKFVDVSDDCSDSLKAENRELVTENKSLKSENSRLRQELERLKQQVLSISEVNKKLEEVNKKLEEENTGYRENETAIMRILRPR